MSNELKRYLEPDLGRAMTVKDLREALADFDDEMPVVFAYTSSDYWRTVVAERIENVDEGIVAWSAYHDKPKIVEDDGSEDDDDRTTTVVVLS